MNLVNDFMKNVYLLVIVVLIFSSSCSEPKENTLAQVGDYSISVNEFEKRYTDYIVTSGVEDNAATRRAILNNMVNEILLKEYDDNSSVEKNEEYNKEKEWLYKQSLLAFLKDREVYRNISASNEEIREAFKKMNQTLTARHLYAATEEEANELYQLLMAGVSFNTLAQQTFTDSTLRKNGGYLGSFTWGDMDPTFEDTVYTLEIGEISKPVKTRTGYSIIKLEDKEYNPLLTEYQFQQKKSHIENTIKIRKKKPSERDFIESLFDKKKFNINDTALGNLLNYVANNQITLNEKSNFENELIATYDGTEYYADQILKRIENLPVYHRTKINSIKRLNATIEGFAIQDILLEEAKAKNYDKNEQMLETYQTQVNNLFLRYKAEEVAEKVEVDDSTLKKYYNEHLEFFSTHDEVNVQEIIVNDKALATNLLQRYKSGEDFGKLARQYSLREWSANNNGEIGFAPIGKFGILKSDFWKASVGDIVGPREIDGYFGLFKVIGKKESNPIEYDLIKNEVLKVFREDRQNQLLMEYLSYLKSKVDIDVDEQLLTSLKISLLN